MNYFVVDYNDLPGEFRRTTDGAIIAKLSGVVEKVNFSPDQEARFFVVDYEDGHHSELWDTYGDSLSLADLDLTAKSYFFDPGMHRLTILYADDRTYILDLDWLRSMRGKATSLSADELIRLACEGPFSSGFFDEKKLISHLGEEEPQSCR